MKYVDDITELFTSFGASAISYQEIQPNYKNFKDDVMTPSASMAETVLTEALSSLAATIPVLLPDEPKPMFGALVEPANNLVISPPSAKSAVLSEAPAAPEMADLEQLSDLLRELNQVRRDGLAQKPRMATRAKVIAVVSANGGVGKSTLAAGLAKARGSPAGEPSRLIWIRRTRCPATWGSAKGLQD